MLYGPGLQQCLRSSCNITCLHAPLTSRDVHDAVGPAVAICARAEDYLWTGEGPAAEVDEVAAGTAVSPTDIDLRVRWSEAAHLVRRSCPCTAAVQSKRSY